MPRLAGRGMRFARPRRAVPPNSGAAVRAKDAQKVSPCKNYLAEKKPLIGFLARPPVSPCGGALEPFARPTFAIAKAWSFWAAPLLLHSATVPRTSPSAGSSPQYLPIDFPVLSGYKGSTSCCPASNGSLRVHKKEVGVVGWPHLRGADRMNQLKQVCVAVSLCLAMGVAAWGQTPNASVVYVATGQSQVYAVPTSGSGSFTPLIPSTSPYSTGGAYSSLAVGPDNSTDNAGSNGWFFLYACDQTNGTIVRLQMSVNGPGAQANNTDLVTHAVPAPVCGRVDANGDLYVSSATAGQGVWVIPGVSATAGGSNYAGTPTEVSFVYPANSSFVGGGIAQKNVGDMLLVDTNGGQILKAAFKGGLTPFANDGLSQYVTGLSAPVGIVRAEVPETAKKPTTAIGDFFVLSQTRQGYALLKFDPSTLPGALANSSVCVSPPSGSATLTSVAASEDNFLYVGVGGNSKNKWAVDILSASNCQGSGTISLSTLASPTGVALPPVPAPPTTYSTKLTDPATGDQVNSYNFGSSLWNVGPGTCTSLSNVTQTPMPLSFLNSLLANPTPPPSEPEGGTLAWYGGTAAAANGESGFGTVFHLKALPSGCQADQMMETNLLIDEFYDTATVTNLWIVHCEDFAAETRLTCDVLDPSGYWPTSGYLPNDGTGGGKVQGFGSEYFLVNGNQTTSSADLGTFCGYENPLVNGATLASAPTFSSGQGLSVKFKLGSYESGGCSGGNYVTDAVALLSIAQILDKQGNPTFVPITINTQGSSTGTPPIFKFNSNSQNYQFSLSLKGYSAGTYVLTVLFLTDNLPDGTPISETTTYFKVQ